MLKLKLFFSMLIVAVSAGVVFAVDVPDFSFKGEEVASFNIAPKFRDINLSLAVPSAYTNYIEKQNIGIASDEAFSYEAEEPSFIYKYRPTTAIASLFVGDKAYRNYTVKNFIQGNKERVVYAYDEYKDDFGNDEYKEEVTLLYGVTLASKGDKRGEHALYDLCLAGEAFRDEACDKYTEILWDRQGYTGIMEVADKMHRPYPVYTFSAYVLSAIKRGDYSKASKLISDNPDLIYKYPDFNDLRAATEYYKGNYSGVVKLIPYTSDNISFVNADSLINTGKYKEADRFVMKVPNQDDRRYLEAKSKIGQNKLKEASAALKHVIDNDERLELLRFYVAKQFPNMSPAFLAEFTFDDPNITDYPSYYEGLQQLELKNYPRAADLFAKVRAPDDLVLQAKFYRGIALVYTDPVKAESDIIATMNYSKDASQIATARFMLAQVYYMKGRYDDSMQLLDGCNEAYCKQLRGEIYLQRGRYDTAMLEMEGIDTPQAHLIRATAYYNKMEYDLAQQELNLIKSSSKEVQHLRMMLLFKEGDQKGATNLLLANQTYQPMLSDGVKELMLAGDYQTAEKLMGNMKNMSPEMEVVNAKLLARAGKTDEAKSIYEKLIRENKLLYDAYYGIITLEKSSEGEMGRVSTVTKQLSRTGDFPQKDLLLSQMASIAARAKENVTLIQIINQFFPAYEDSQYASDMYAERAKLFYSTGRSEECLRDIEMAVKKNPFITEEMRFSRAQCTEAVDVKQALAEYRSMFKDNDQYRLPAAVKIMDLSLSSSEVLDTANAVKAESPQLYVEGVRRYVEIAKPNELSANGNFVEQLKKDKSKSLKCAGLFAEARLQNESGKGKEAAKTYYAVYETDPKDHFTPQSLDAAIEIYTKLKMTAEADSAQEARKKLKTKSTDK